MQTEIEQYEREIAERRKVFSQRERDFAALRFSMTPAEKAQHEAEVCPIVEVFIWLGSTVVTFSSCAGGISCK